MHTFRQSESLFAVHYTVGQQQRTRLQGKRLVFNDNDDSIMMIVTLGPVYTIPDSYRRAATFVSDRGVI